MSLIILFLQLILQTCSIEFISKHIMKLADRKILQNLVQAAWQLKINYNPQLSLLEQCHKYSIFDFMGFKINMLRKVTTGVGIRTLFDYEDLRISLYYLPIDTVMKLHDHHDMQVISYVLEGRMEAKLYTPLEDGYYRKNVKTVEERSHSLIQDNNNNLHQFKALQNTLFLDIIFPDYTIDNPCKFYQEQQIIDENKVKLKEIDEYQVQFFDI